MDRVDRMAEGLEAPTVPDVNFATNRTVNCADDPRAPRSDSEAAALMGEWLDRYAPLAWNGFAAIACGAWEVPADPAPAIEYSPETPPLIVAGTADTRTPRALAEELSGAIEGAVLLTSEHYGHGAISWAGPCVAQAIANYLALLRLPAPGTVCPAL